MKRLQFDLPEERVNELDTLAERTGLKTRVQLFNAALTLFEWAVREREAGRMIASVNEKNSQYKEVDMPGLPAPTRAGEREIPELLAEVKSHLETPAQFQILATLADTFNVDLKAEAQPDQAFWPPPHNDPEYAFLLQEATARQQQIERLEDQLARIEDGLFRLVNTRQVEVSALGATQVDASITREQE